MWVVLIICASIVLIVGLTCGIEEGIKPFLDYKYKKLENDRKKLEEEHSTANLAIMYQILSARPELSLEDVQKLLETKKDKELLIEEK